jgi:hypothetical protein
MQEHLWNYTALVCRTALLSPPPQVYEEGKYRVSSSEQYQLFFGGVFSLSIVRYFLVVLC